MCSNSSAAACADVPCANFFMLMQGSLTSFPTPLQQQQPTQQHLALQQQQPLRQQKMMVWCYLSVLMHRAGPSCWCLMLSAGRSWAGRCCLTLHRIGSMVCGCLTALIDWRLKMLPADSTRQLQLAVLAVVWLADSLGVTGGAVLQLQAGRSWAGLYCLTLRHTGSMEYGCNCEG
jgi:hypothetical protein